MRDFNIDAKLKGNGYRNLEEFCDMLADTETCVTNSHKSTIGLILTNKPSSFHKTMVTKTGLSDFRKLFSTFFKGGLV